MSNHLPKPYTRFLESFPEVGKAYQALGQACHEAGPLDLPIRHLIKLGVATAQQSEGGVKAHVRQALDAGASVADVHHAILLSLTTTGFPEPYSAMKAVGMPATPLRMVKPSSDKVF